MRAALSVPKTIAKSLGAFLESEEIPLGIVMAGDTGVAAAAETDVAAGASPAEVSVVQSREGCESTASVLHAGGSITCGLARDMADRLGIKRREIGKLLNHLNIKVRACELGCFE